MCFSSLGWICVVTLGHPGTECGVMWESPHPVSSPAKSPPTRPSNIPPSTSASASSSSGGTTVHRPIPLPLSVAQEKDWLLIRTKMPVCIWPDTCLLGCALNDLGVSFFKFKKIAPICFIVSYHSFLPKITISVLEISA